MKPTPHRSLYNGDCTFLFGGGYLLDEDAPFSVEVLERFVDRLVEGGVDTYLQNPNAQKPWYPSRALSSVLDGYTRGDQEFVRGHYPPANATDLPPEVLEGILARDTRFLDRYLDLLDAGIDWLAEMARICRERGVSPWLSVRMNDLHGANSWEGSYMNCELQKQPQYRLSGRSPNPARAPQAMEQALDYGHPEVRDYYFMLIRDVVVNYDFEGLELDWNRCAFCCEPPASRESRETMTGWVADIRRLTEERARQTGRPYPLGLCIPPRVGMLREIGLDVQTMAHAGLIDFISPSNFWQATWDVPYDELRTLVGDEVAIYGVIDSAPNWLEARSDTGEQSYRMTGTSAELLRGNAAGKLALGCDGIEVYNFFCADEIGIHPTAEKRLAKYAELRGIADLEVLRGQPKQYVLSSQKGHYMFPLWEQAEQVPVTIEPEHRQRFRLSMCAETEAAGKLIVQIVTEKSTGLPRIGVSFNGSWPNFEGRPDDALLFRAGHHVQHIEKHQAWNYEFDLARIKGGWNEILLFNDGAQSVRVESLELGVF